MLERQLRQFPILRLVVVNLLMTAIVLLPTGAVADPTRPPSSGVETDTAWRESIEDRLLSLEQNLEKLLTHLAGLDGETATEAAQAVEEMSNETEMIQAEVTSDQPV